MHADALPPVPSSAPLEIARSFAHFCITMSVQLFDITVKTLHAYFYSWQSMENNCAGKHLFSAVQDINFARNGFFSVHCYAQISPVAWAGTECQRTSSSSICRRHPHDLTSCTQASPHPRGKSASCRHCLPSRDSLVIPSMQAPPWAGVRRC